MAKLTLKHTHAARVYPEDNPKATTDELRERIRALKKSYQEQSSKLRSEQVQGREHGLESYMPGYQYTMNIRGVHFQGEVVRADLRKAIKLRYFVNPFNRTVEDESELYHNLSVRFEEKERKALGELDQKEEGPLMDIAAMIVKSIFSRKHLSRAKREFVIS